MPLLMLRLISDYECHIAEGKCQVLIKQDPVVIDVVKSVTLEVFEVQIKITFLIHFCHIVLLQLHVLIADNSFIFLSDETIS